MKAYYNEIDKYAAQWLRNLIAAGHLPDGDVDERDIKTVQPDDLRGYNQVHLFAGIGGWPLALKYAGWPDDQPVWTGSCPCQALSTAARGRNLPERDLQAEFIRLIAARTPSTIFGEQVAKGEWFDHFCIQMENLGYSIGATVLPAISVEKDHIRKRLYFVCDTNLRRKPSCTINAETSIMSWNRRDAGNMANSYGVSARVGKLRAYGNAIVPQVAAEFIKAYLETKE